MDIPSKQLKSGFKIPVFGLGTWQVGGKKERDLDNDDEAEILAIKTAINLGITLIDTAEIYAAGHAETLISKAISGHDRSKLFITSKVLGEHLSYNELLLSFNKSLKRLNTDYLDLYLIHFYNPNIPLSETFKALDHLVSEGLVKNIGVSNFGLKHLKEAQNCTNNRIVYNQVHYNLKFREPEKDLLQYCQENDIFLAAWRPLEKGAIIGEDILSRLSQKYQKTPAQIAINWLISQDNVVTLSKSLNLEHLKENLGALGWNLQDEDIELLRKEFPNQQTVSDAVPLSS